MPASTSQRRTKPKVRRNSDVIDVVELFEVSDSPDKTSEDKESEDKESDSLDKKCTITLEHEGRTKTRQSWCASFPRSSY